MSKEKSIIGTVQTVLIKNIISPEFIARNKMDEEKLQELREDIRQNGLIQMIVVKPKGSKFEIVAGHRRFTAIKQLKWERIDVMVTKGNKLDTDLIKFAENAKRDDLNDMEEARSFDHLKRLGKLTNKAIAKKVGKSEAYVTQKLGLLKYPDYMQFAIAEKKLTFSAARELIRITDPIVLKDYVSHAVDSGITPAVAKQWVEDWLRMQKFNKDDAASKGDNSENQEPERVKVPCYICKRHFLVENTIMIRACKKDLEALRQAMNLVEEEAE